MALIARTIVLVLGVLGAFFLLSVAIMEYRRALPFPETGRTYWSSLADFPRVATLKIVAPASAKRRYAVELQDAGSGEPVMVIFVHPGETAIVAVPLGRYVLTTHKGYFWQGARHLFGMTGASQRMAETLHFYRSGNQIVGHLIHLDAVTKNR